MEWRVFVPNVELLPVLEVDLEAVEMICRVLGKRVHRDNDNRILYIQSPVVGKKIVLDAGHGGGDNHGRGVSGFVEGDGVLDIALRLKKRLVSAGALVVLTREGDVSVSISERRKLIQETRPDMLLSIHTGASWNTAIRGVATYYSLYRFFGSRRLARKITVEAGKATGGPSRGAFFKWPGMGFDGYLSLLNAYPCPSVIVECGCHSSTTEEKLLMTDDYRDRCSDGIFSGIMSYFGTIPIDEVMMSEITDKVAASKVRGGNTWQVQAKDIGKVYEDLGAMASMGFTDVILRDCAGVTNGGEGSHGTQVTQSCTAPRVAEPAGPVVQTQQERPAISVLDQKPQLRSCSHREIVQKLMAVELKNKPRTQMVQSFNINPEPSSKNIGGPTVMPGITLSELSKKAVQEGKDNRITNRPKVEKK